MRVGGLIEFAKIDSGIDRLPALTTQHRERLAFGAKVLADRDKKVCQRTHQSLQANVELAFPRRHETMKWKGVVSMDHARNSAQPGRQPAQEASFGSVGVDQVELLPPEKANDLEKSAHILHRAKWCYQAGQRMENVPCFNGAINPMPVRITRDVNLVDPPVMQLGRAESVILRAAHDRERDQMQYFESPLRIAPMRVRSAGFQTCCIAGFQTRSRRYMLGSCIGSLLRQPGYLFSACGRCRPISPLTPSPS